MKLNRSIYFKSMLLMAALIQGVSALAQTATQNYVRSRVPRVPITTNTRLDQLTPTNDSVQTTIQYVDGLGRPLQTVMQKASPLGKDIIQPFVYDAFGREAVRYLPYSSTSTSYGSYRSDALTTGQGVSDFYNPGGGTTEGKQTNGIVRTQYPGAVTGFEPSPLNRVVEQGAPGAAWQVNGNVNGDANSGNNTVRIVYTANDQTAFANTVTNNPGSRRAALYRANINPDGSRSMTRGANYTDYYLSGQLSVTITRDENWKPADGCFGTTEEYKDKEGHVVLKRTYNLKASPVVNTPPTPEMLSTYYVYDDLGNLCFVLPPGSSPESTSPMQQATFDTKCYQYRYDARNRLAQKKVPGKGWEFMIYNKLDQVVATQDSVQRMKPTQEWTITKYDAMGRPVISGIWQYGTTVGADNHAAVQGLADGVAAQWETFDGSAGTGYTANAWPLSWGATLNVSYYDSYANIPNFPAAYDQTANAAYTTRTKGLLTASRVLVLNTTADYLWTVPYYDEDGQVVRSFSQHYLGGTTLLSPFNYDDVTTTYNFVKQPMLVVRKHYAAVSGAPVLRLTANDTYTYDHMGRKRTTYSQLKDGSNATQDRIIVARSTYNEVGQLLKKGLHSANNGTSFLQTLNYRYNARGWLTNINNPSLTSDGGYTSNEVSQFGMELKYDNTSTSRAQFNGNIATSTVKTANVSTSTYAALTYDYRYDRLNRLTDAVSTTTAAKDGYHNEYLTYDNMGNIAALGRYDNVGGTRTQIDSLTYFNTGNRPQRIDDAVTAAQYSGTWGFTDGTQVNAEYKYDGNGNQITDKNKGSYVYGYNMLNLPQTITKGSGASIIYVYDAGGRKLRKIFADGGSTMTTEYVNGIEYDNGTSAITFVQTEEGRARKNGAVYKYEYDLKDHLGNTRLTATWDGNDATQLMPSNQQHTDYYAFGYTIQSTQTTVVSPQNHYLYNGKELQEETGLYDYGARFYDPVIARWTSVDPLAENNRRWTPYNYAVNNPIRYIDPDGRDTAQRNAAVREAGRWVAGNDNGKGNTYRLGAKGDDGPGSEIDCSGLISKVVVAGGEKDPNHGTSNGITNIDNNLPNVDPKDVVPGNVVTLSNDSHGGLITLVQRDKQGNIINEQMTDSGGKPSSGTSGPRVSNLIKDGKLTYWGKLIVSYNKFDTKPDAPSSGGSTSSATTTTQTSTMGSLWNSFKKAVSSLMEAATH